MEAKRSEWSRMSKHMIFDAAELLGKMRAQNMPLG